MKTLRARLSTQVDPELHAGRGLSLFNLFMLFAILASISLGILQTEPSLPPLSGRIMSIAQLILLALFVLEYGLRVWTSVENPAHSGRLRYMLKPASLLDLLVILLLFSATLGAEAFILRFMRLMRLLMLARLTRFSSAMVVLVRAVSSRRYELLASASLALGLLTLTSSVLYVIEGEHQPDAFGSIPRAMWWSVATLTTVGYGDVVPSTVIGKICAGLSALAGVGLVAMPAGILAAAFSEALQDMRKSSAQ